MDTTLMKEEKIIEEFKNIDIGFVDDLRYIGTGAFAYVFSAVDSFDDEKVAIKVLDEDKINDHIKKRFEREIKIHQQLKHENIISIREFNVEGLNYYIMPLADRNLAEEIKEYRSDNLGETMDDGDVEFYFRQILEGVKFAHSEGIIHRDLKPLNILVFGDTLKISDFGLGKFINRDTTILTKTSTMLGSECYAAPEQYGNGDASNADVRTDIFALGKILYELISFDVPVYINDTKIKKSKYRFIIKKATKVDIDERYQTIEEMIRDFDIVSKGGRKSKNEKEDTFKDILVRLNEKISSADVNAAIRILLSNSRKYELYVNEFMLLDLNILKALKEGHSVEFGEIISNYLKIIDCRHTFSFVDKIIDFILSFVDYIDDDDEIYQEAIRVIANLGVGHNRYYVGIELNEYLKELENVGSCEKVLLASKGINKVYNVEWFKSFIDEEIVKKYGIGNA